MAKGMRVKLNYDVSRDPDTGAEITRLTPPEVTCHRNYFYQKCFFNDGSHLLFAGEFDGNWNYYLLDLAKAEAVSQSGVGLVAPVVEIAGDDQRRAGLGDAFQISGQCIHLPPPRTGEK